VRVLTGWASERMMPADSALKRLWLRLLLLLAWLRLYVLARAILIALHVHADLLVECGDHDGRLRFRDLPWLSDDGSRLVRPRTIDD
jgi:hypothetical protein